MQEQIGTKAASLQSLAAEFPNLVPRFEILIFSDIFVGWNQAVANLNNVAERYLAGKQNVKRLEREVETQINSLEINEKYLVELRENLKDAGLKKVSYRTSAVLEDLDQSSFAGQYVTFLEEGTKSATIIKNAKRCAKSLFSTRVLEYAHSKGGVSFHQGGSMVIQEMFYGRASGVLFTENGRNQIELSFTRSWRNLTVEGEQAHSLTIPKRVPDSDSIFPADLPSPISQVIEAALKLEEREARPLDIEWSVSGQRAALLQMRPVTSLSVDYTIEWDNSNISESYPDITLPLTYSFIRNLYANVYPEFLKLLKIPDSALLAKKHVFENMLGYLDGRVYYNINNWYEVVKFMPGYRFNKGFFEAMLIPAKDKGEASPPKKKLTVRERLGLLSAAVRFVRLLLRTDKLGKTFTGNYLKRYKTYNGIQWEHIAADEIVYTLDRIERDLLKQWAVPILNDFRTMIFHGLLRKLFFPRKNDKNYVQLLQGIYDHTSVEPIRELNVLATKLQSVLKKESVNAEKALKAIEHKAEFAEIRSDITAYLETYGGRSPGELKLENPRLSESFTIFASFVLSTAKGLSNSSKTKDLRVDEKTITRKVLGHYSPLKRLPMRFIFRFVLHRAKLGISKRERFRFYRAQVFGFARKGYLALGKRFVRADLIDSQDDIFYLTKAEINEVVLGHAPDLALRDKIRKRKSAFKTYAEREPIRRKVSRGLIATLNTEADDSVRNGRKALSGLGVSKGVFRGEVVVVKEFDPNADVKGKILVTQQTDPGWTLLFLNAAALVVERGNALSHASIVARELGIPAVVGVEEACSLLKNNQRITVNGSTGELVAK